jgi:ribosomal protein S7
MPGEKDIHTMIDRRDSVALRRMAEEARKPETRMFLALLAEMIDQQRKKSMRLKRTA